MQKRCIKLLAFVLILGMFPICLTGCWDRLEVEELAFVAVIGLDRLGEDKLEVTYVISNPQGGGFNGVIGSSQNEPPAETITINGSDILSARDLLGASVTRRITFSHMKVLIISEELAKSDMLLRGLEAFVRDRQIRRDIFMIISKEKASEFIRGNKPLLETRPHKFYEFISQRWKESALVPLSNIHRFIQTAEGKAGVFINIYGSAKETGSNKEGFEDEYLPGEIQKTGGDPSQFIGSAVFKDGIMIGTLTGEETRISQILRPNFKISSMLMTLPDPGDPKHRISGRIAKEKFTEIKMDTKGERLALDVKVPVIFDILAVPSGIDYIEDLEKQRQLKDYIEKVLEEKTDGLVKRTQKEFKGEPFLWSHVLRTKFSTWDEYVQYHYMEKYPAARVTVRYDLNIRRLGKQLRPPDFSRIGSGEQ